MLEEFIGDAYAFTEQASGILPQIEEQSLQIAHLIQSLGYFMLGGFLESGDVHVTDARLNHEVQVHAVARNLVADDCEFERLVGAFPQHRDPNRGAFRSLEQIGNIGGAHVVGGLAVDGGANVGVAAGRGCGADFLRKQHSQQTEQSKHENDQEERTARTTSHVSKSSGRDVEGPATPSERSITCESASYFDAKARLRLHRGDGFWWSASSPSPKVR